MANEIRIKAILDDKVSSGLDKIKDKLDTIGGKGTGSTAFGVVAAKGMNLIAGAASAAGGAVVDFVQSSIQAASDLNETISKAHVIFGTSTDDLVKWGKTAATSMGMSENAALAAAASIGNLLLSTGTAPEKIAPMSKGIVQLASDLASFNNIPIEDALAKLQSGLVGQERPLRELGVAISAASVDTEAATLGFIKQNGVFTEGEKVQARYALIFKQTSTAQGDFARTSDQLANSQRIANAQLEDFSATLGTKMLPAQLAVTKAQVALFTSLSPWVDAMSGNVTPDTLALAKATNNVDGEVTKMVAQFHTLPMETLRTAAALGLVSTKLVDQEAATRASIKANADWIVQTGGMARAVDDTLVPMSDTVHTTWNHTVGAVKAGLQEFAVSATAAVHITHSAFDDLISASKVARIDMLGDATKIVDKYYTVLIDKDQLLATNVEINALRKKVALGKASAAEIAQLHQDEQTQASLEADLASHGATQSKVFKDTMAGYLKQLATAHGTERTAILAEIRQLQLLNLAADTATNAIGRTIAKHGYVSAAGATAHVKPKTHAAGGSFSAGDVSMVGEQGPELRIETGNGYYIPNNRLAQSGGSGGSVHLHVHSIWPPTPLQVKAIADAIDHHEYFATGSPTGNRT